MNTHSRLALKGAAVMVALALPVGAMIGYYTDRAHAVAFLYGVGVGVASFASIALTVSLLLVRPSGLRILLGTAVYAGRLLFAAVAVGLPIYLNLWPVLPLLCGFAGVYVAENVLLLAMAPKTTGHAAVSSARGGVERRSEV